jgi:hypothetical protein
MEVGLLDIADIEGHIELGADLCARTLRSEEELLELSPTPAFETFGNI